METPSITYIPFGDYSVHFGFLIDGSKVQFWASKKQAGEAAKTIGWRVCDVTKIHTRFCNGWALSDGRFGFISKASFEASCRARSGGDHA